MIGTESCDNSNVLKDNANLRNYSLADSFRMLQVRMNQTDNAAKENNNNLSEFNDN